MPAIKNITAEISNGTAIVTYSIDRYLNDTKCDVRKKTPIPIIKPIIKYALRLKNENKQGLLCVMLMIRVECFKNIFENINL